MSFESTERIMAAPANAVSVMFQGLLDQYGETLPDGNRSIRTIGGHWDNAEKTRIRAASLTDGTITGQPLTDGRVAFCCLWQSNLAKDFDDGKINGVEELTEAQLAALTLNPEEL